MTANATPRLVTYLAPELFAEVPPELVADWPAEDSCAKAEALLAGAEDDEERALTLADLRSFEADILQVLRRKMLPFGNLISHLTIGPLGGYQLVGQRGFHKVRVDQELNIALIRSKPLDLSGPEPRIVKLRQELRDTLCVPLGSVDKKPVRIAAQRDLSALEPGAIYAEIDGPTGTGYVGGRFSRMRVYSDGKVLLVGFVPLEVTSGFIPPGRPGTADASDPAFQAMALPQVPALGAPLTGPPPRPGSASYTAADAARAAKNRDIAARQEQARAAGGGGATSGGSAAGSAATGTGGAAGGPSTTSGAAEAGAEGLSPLEKARASRQAAKATGGGGAAGGGAGGGAGGEAAPAATGAKVANEPTLRLDKNGEVQSDDIDLKAWERGELDD